MCSCVCVCVCVCRVCMYVCVVGWGEWLKCKGCFLLTTDSAYSDPLGDMPQRPKTSSRPRQGDDVDFNDVELGDDLLPV